MLKHYYACSTDETFLQAFLVILKQLLFTERDLKTLTKYSLVTGSKLGKNNCLKLSQYTPVAKKLNWWLQQKLTNNYINSLQDGNALYSQGKLKNPNTYILLEFFFSRVNLFAITIIIINDNNTYLYSAFLWNN